MTNKELQFALDKALEIAKEKDMQIRRISEQIDFNKDYFDGIVKAKKYENDKLKDRIKRLDRQNRILNDLVSVNDNTSARMTISAIIGIAAGFILALILL